MPQVVAGSDIIGDGARTVRVPVRMLEHYRFKLRPDANAQGVGQGSAKPGDLLGEANARQQTRQQGCRRHRTRPDPSCLLEFKVDDIIDWMWEELQQAQFAAARRPIG